MERGIRRTGRRALARRMALLALMLCCSLALNGCDESGVPTFKNGELTSSDSPKDVTTVMRIVLVLTILTLAPSILIMTTSFTRIIIVLSFLRRALATQQLPPNQIVVGLSLILTFLVMGPTWQKINDEAVTPYTKGDIKLPEAFEKAKIPVMHFMARQTRPEDYELFASMAHQELPENPTLEDLSLWTLLPAFTISELSRAFIMGFILYLPFLIVDLVIATTLISMGMLVLPPILISLPFKILLFVLVDGWHLVVGSLVSSFY